MYYGYNIVILFLLFDKNNMYKKYQLKQYNILHNSDEVDDDLANYKVNIISIEHNKNNNNEKYEELEEITLR